MTLQDQIEQILPQTQCQQCGYKGCKLYAEAIVEGAMHNRCPAGGNEVIQKLSELLHRDFVSLDESCGVHVEPEVAKIDPKKCIGCKLCIDACPTEAIIGSPKHMHMVDVDYCNGCCLCQIACPMDCISMVSIDRAWSTELANQSKHRYELKQQRQELRQKALNDRLNKKSQVNKKAFLEMLKQKAAK